MPYSFTQIEKEKGRVIAFVFSALLAFYFITAFILYVACKNLFLAQYTLKQYQAPFHWQWISSTEALWLFAIAFFCGIGHWVFTVNGLVEKILGILKAERLNPEDKYHVVFRNIIDEVSVATGGVRIEGVVIPVCAMNAFAISDFSGRNVIGVTEGLLARLSRAQLEAVVGHEAAHIVSGDCLSTTVTTAMFEIYHSIRQILGHLMTKGRSSKNGDYGVIPGIFVIYALLSFASFMGHLLRLFVSRQRELRADATAVRLTRDPLSLAEALYSVSSRWRGAGLAGEELEAIFIVNPRFDQLDEKEGLIASIFSTHPPVSKRLKVLLDMARSDVSALERKWQEQRDRPRVLAPETRSAPPDQLSADQKKKWIVNKEGQWQGPFSLPDLMNLGWMRSDTWIKKMGAGEVQQAFENAEIRDFLWKKEQQTGFSCPHCRVGLFSDRYEGANAYYCPSCGGAFVKENNVHRIIIRQDYEFSERIKEAARKFYAQTRRDLPKVDLTPASLYYCPQCQKPKVKMMRMLYTLAYPVVVDKCSFCGFFWFDKDELEILQCMIEDANRENAKSV